MLELVSPQAWAKAFGLPEILMMKELHQRAPMLLRTSVLSCDCMRDTAEDVLLWEKSVAKLPADLKPTQSQTRQLVKALAKKSVPCECRGVVWLCATGGASLLQARPAMYDEARAVVLGDTTTIHVGEGATAPMTR